MGSSEPLRSLFGILLLQTAVSLEVLRMDFWFLHYSQAVVSVSVRLSCAAVLCIWFGCTLFCLLCAGEQGLVLSEKEALNTETKS